MVIIKSILFVIVLRFTIALPDSMEGTNADGSKKSINFLQIIGIPSKPLAYIEKQNDHPKGIDVSLVAALAKKLNIPTDIQLNGTYLTFDDSPTTILGYFVNK